jgi:hypothetical protein
MDLDDGIARPPRSGRRRSHRSFLPVVSVNGSL